MIPPELRAEIRRLFYAEHWKFGTIASQLHVHPETVANAVEASRFVSNGRQFRSGLDPYLAFIEATLEKYPRLRATRVHEMIVARGYNGSVVQTRRAVRRLRPKPKGEAYLRLATLPGEQGQVDWGHFGYVQIGRAKRPLSAFVMVLSWSRALHALFTLDQTLESFLRGHVEAFDFFGGAPRVLLYDNLKAAVLQRIGSVAALHPRLLEFAGHYHFRPQPVAVARGNEKGRVERAIRFLRDRFFAARPFHDVDDLNAQFCRWRDEWAHARPCPEDNDLTVREAFRREQAHLLPLPENPFSTDRLTVVRSGKTPYVRFDLNDYSIPHTLIRKPLTVIASTTTVRILDGTTEVARHARSWDRHAQLEQKEHIEALVQEKRSAREGRARTQITRAVPGAMAFLEEVVRREGNLGSATAQLRRLLEDYGPLELGAAIEEAMKRGTPTPASVAHLLDQARRRSRIPPKIRLELPDNPRIREIRVTQHKLETYDDLTTDPDE